MTARESYGSIAASSRSLKKRDDKGGSADHEGTAHLSVGGQHPCLMLPSVERVQSRRSHLGVALVPLLNPQPSPSIRIGYNSRKAFPSGDSSGPPKGAAVFQLCRSRYRSRRNYEGGQYHRLRRIRPAVAWPWPAKSSTVLRLFTSYAAGRSNLSSVATRSKKGV